jgi:hypothetical protein
MQHYGKKSLHSEEKSVMLRFLGRVSPFEKGTMEREPLAHSKTAHEFPRRFKHRKAVEATLWHWAFECSVLEVLTNLLGELEGIDSKISIPVMESLVKELCPNFLNEVLLLGVRKDPLRSSSARRDGRQAGGFCIICRHVESVGQLMCTRLERSATPPKGISVCNAWKTDLS